MSDAPLPGDLDAVLRAVRSLHTDSEALASLLACVPLRHPLPRLGEWTLGAEAAVTLLDLVLDRRPRSIVELGSGISTVILGYAVEKVGWGRVVSLDHSTDHANRTRRLLELHGLDHLAIEVRHAPLTADVLDGHPTPWCTTRRRSTCLRWTFS